MAKTRPLTAAQTKALLAKYFAKLAPKGRKRMNEVRRVIRAAVPGIEEAYSYQIPAFRLNGRMLIWYAAWTEHTSLYPLNATMRKAAGPELADYKLAKGTIRIPLTKRLPSGLIKRMVKARAAELRSA